MDSYEMMRKIDHLRMVLFDLIKRNADELTILEVENKLCALEWMLVDHYQRESKRRSKAV